MNHKHKIKKGSENLNPSVSVKSILAYAWEWYLQSHYVREIEAREVEKTLNCYSYENGPFVYVCKECGEYIFQRLGCNSRLCSCCGKRYTDQWARSLSKAMFKVPHRHFVLSVPLALWPWLKQDRKRWKVYMDSAIAACNDYFSHLMREVGLRVGIIVILHPFGKDLKLQLHLHLLITEGGFTRRGKFIKREFIPARKFARCWQYHVLANFQKHGLPSWLATEMYERYDGFYVWLHRAGKIKHPRLVAKYTGRYVRHPAIANSRLTGFDGTKVDFYYEEWREGEKVRRDVTMGVEEFISALLQHLPEKQFKMIRYYGAYARGKKRLYATYLQSSITQSTLYRFGFGSYLRKKLKCPYCGGELKFVCYCRKPPPEELKPQRELTNWISCNFNN